MWYEFKNLDLGIIFDVSLLSKKGNLCNAHFTVSYYKFTFKLTITFTTQNNYCSNLIK